MRQPILAAALAAALFAQCPQPPALTASNDPNLFTEAQESDLGDAIAEHTQRTIPIVSAGEEGAYLEKIGARLLAHFPKTQIQFRFHFIDIASPNAFVLPGGRVYVSRKLIAFVNNEDELAGVIGHELGHVLARQGSRRMTRTLRTGLNVNSIGDRADVFEKYNRLLDAVMKKKISGPKYVDEEVAADQLSLFAAARAGYDPEAMLAFFDRLTENKGATGSALSDFFGITRPESKRVREMTRTLASLPKECRDTQSRPSTAEFNAWRDRVANLESVRSVSTIEPVQKLSPELRPDITHLTFSPEGKTLLAQDDSGINVLTVQPFETRGRIPAVDVSRAIFTPDSRMIHFVNESLRVEQWDLLKGARVAVREVVVNAGCDNNALSPDGKHLACYGGDYKLRIFEVASSKLVAEKHFPRLMSLNSVIMELNALLSGRLSTLFNYSFSPDGRYIVAAARQGMSIQGPWAFDLETKAQVKLPGALNDVLTGGFAFIAADRIAGIHGSDHKKSGILSFPKGEIVQRVAIPPLSIDAVAKGPYLIVRPFRDNAAAIMSIDRGEVFKVSRNGAVDIFDSFFVSERGSGEIGLYPIDKSEPIAVAQLPQGDLGRPRAAAVSPDLKRVALSTATRSGFWNVNEAEGALLRGATSLQFADNDKVLVDFPKFQKEDRRIVTVDLAARKVTDTWVYPEGESPDLRGPRLVEVSRKEKAQSITVREAATRKDLWKTSLDPEAQSIFSTTNAVAVLFALDSKFAKQLLRDNAVKERLFAGKKPAGQLVQILDAQTGKEQGIVAIDDTAFMIRAVRVAATTVFISDSQNRVHLFDLKTAEAKGRVFGRILAANNAGTAFCIENEPGDVRLHDTAKATELAKWQLDAPALTAAFAADGKRLLLVSAKQNVFVVEVE